MSESSSDDVGSYERVQKRLFNTLQFRLQSEINIRDDEIQRLQEKLEWFRSQRQLLVRQVDPAYLNELKQQLFARQTELKMALADASIAHEKQLQQMEKTHRELANRKQEAVHIDVSSDTTSSDDTVDKFLSSIKGATEHARKAHEIKVPEYDPIEEGAKELQLQTYQEEIQRHKERMLLLKNMIEKVKSKSVVSLQSVITESEEEKEKESENIEDIDSSIEGMLRDFIEKVDDLKEEHQEMVVEFTRRIKIERKQKRKRERAIEAARKRGSETDAELAQSILAEKRIITRKQRKYDYQNETLMILMEKSEEEKESYVEQLQSENMRLKKEISRLDFAVYGRNGKYRNWKNPTPSSCHSEIVF